MPRCSRLCAYLITPPRFNLTVKRFFVVSTLFFTLTFFGVLIVNQPNSPPTVVIQNVLEEVAQNPRFAEVYRKAHKLPPDLKYLLLWTPTNFFPFNFLKSGQRGFITYNCSNINCYVTSDRNFFKGDITRFDAIAFNGRNIDYMSRRHLPRQRDPRQKFIYVNTESSEYFPVCSNMFENFFNWTSTYRLDSDIPYTYLRIKNTAGEIVGPKQNMKWYQDISKTKDEYSSKWLNKSKAAAWFVSHCTSKSGRNEFVKRLQEALDVYDLTIDIYGKCGTLKCPKENNNHCTDMLEREYFFYLSFENSFAQDYVTEKLLTAVQRDIVPIVYGGANYSRFLPPDSYLDARRYSPEELAATMYELMLSRSYNNFFKWKKYYTYHKSLPMYICEICSALNNATLIETKTVYDNFRYWWNPKYKERCKHRGKW